MSKTYIIDGNSLLFRAFYALFRPGVELMHSKDGTPTNAIYSFKNMMQKIKSELSDNDKMIVCFDTDSKTFRSKELETYKKNRKPLEPALKVQLPLARKLLDAMGIFYYELPGYEGDDIAGSLAKYAAKLGDEVTLFTSDKDFLQLLDDNIVVKFLRKGLSEIELFTKDNIYEKLGFRADQVTDYKGLVGDTSDNFKGIPGIGEKTAVKLLNEYGHLEEIIIGMQSLNTKTAKNIVENAELGRFCKHIATIITDMPNIYEVYDKGQVKDFNYLELRAFYKKYDLYKFYKELEDEILKLNEELNSKKILIKESGSIAEASLKLNHMFEDAQKSIDDYVNNVKAKYEEMLKEVEKKPITKSKENNRKKVKVTIKNSSVKKGKVKWKILIVMIYLLMI